jgi:peroxiredoxin
MNVRPLIFLACVTLLTAYVLRSGVGNDSLVRKGSKAPDFTVKDADGRPVALQDFRGSVVFLNFWRTDCPPCAAEMADMERVARAFSGRKFQMMPVSLDIDAEQVEQFYRDLSLTMPAYIDPGRNVATRYAVRGTPETFIINRDGIVAEYYVGPRNWASPDMLARLDNLIP